MTAQPRYKRSTARQVTAWQRMPYAVQLAVTIVLSAVAFGVGFAVVAMLQDAAGWTG